MMDPKCKVLISMSLPLVLFIGLCVPLILQKVPPNPFYGIRLRKTLENADIWYKANRFGGALIIIAACLSLAAFGFLYFDKDAFSFDALNTIALLSFLGPLAGALILSIGYVKRL